MTSSTHGSGHLLSRAEFSAVLAERLDQEPSIEIISRSEQDMDLKVRGLGVRASLENFYTAYSDNPGELETIIQNFVEVALGFVPNREVSDYSRLQQRIFPMLKPVSLLAEVRERKVPMLAYQLFLSELVVTYVIDEPQSVVFINEEHLERWGIGQNELHSQALLNLQQRTNESANYTVAGEGQQRLFIWNTNDGYDATRLLLTDLLAKWQQQLRGRLVVGIPNRDFLIAFSDSDRTILENIARQVQIDSMQRTYGLTDQLFTIGNGEVREYLWG